MSEAEARKILIKGKASKWKETLRHLPFFRNGIPVRSGIPLPVKGERLVVELELEYELADAITAEEFDLRFSGEEEQKLCYDAAVMAVHPERNTYDIVIRKKIPEEAHGVRKERYEVKDENLRRNRK